MSSALRQVAQIPVQTKYLLVVATSTVPSNDVLDASCVAFTLDEGVITSLGSAVTVAQLQAAANTFTSVVLTAGDLYKDLGRQFTVYDSAAGAASRHLAVFRECQLIDDAGAGTEGVLGAYTAGGPYNYRTLFIKVWAASGAGINVARTGPGGH